LWAVVADLMGDELFGGKEFDVVITTLLAAVRAVSATAVKLVEIDLLLSIQRELADPIRAVCT
jgi:hypothetical protein